MEQVRPFFFVHIPKTAGTSFRQGLAKVPRANLLMAYPNHPKRNERLIAATTPEEGEALLRTLDPERVHIIAGHVPYQRYAHLAPPEHALSLVRNPVERAVSEYQHMALSTPGRFSDLESFLHHGPMRNRQSRLLGGIDPERAQLGLNSHYSEYLELVRRSMGLDIASLSMNHTSKKRTRVRQRLPIGLIRKAFAMNGQDVALLYSVAERFEKRLRALGWRTVPRRSGVFRMSVDRRLNVHGFLEGTALDAGIVSLEVNGDPRAITRLQIDAGGGAGDGMHRFRYSLPLLGAGPGDVLSASLLDAAETRGTIRLSGLRLQWCRAISRLMS
ncbi:hypothetical protein [Arhodomonas sp. AD133]|uniref:hypothetical protein n=1 Tax=Arhodomonas sp. AD133 TaxID=3415009 RepID=UPI003EBD2735